MEGKKEMWVHSQQWLIPKWNSEMAHGGYKVRGVGVVSGEGKSPWAKQAHTPLPRAQRATPCHQPPLPLLTSPAFPRLMALERRKLHLQSLIIF